MKLALCQMVSTPDKSANLAQITALAEAAAAKGADLAIFPEYSMHYIRAMGPDFVAGGEDLDGPFATAITELANRLGLAIITGMTERIDGEDRIHNTLIAVKPGEGIVAVYRKMHLYDAFGFTESDSMRPGELDGASTFVVDGVRVGLLTCYDLRFPEAAREHADAGTELLVYPAAWIPGPLKVEHWTTLARARAIENTIAVAAVSQPPGEGVGHSLVADPAGIVLGQMGDEHGIEIVDFDPARIAEVRATNPSLMNRRFTVAPKP